MDRPLEVRCTTVSCESKENLDQIPMTSTSSIPPPMDHNHNNDGKVKGQRTKSEMDDDTKGTTILVLDQKIPTRKQSLEPSPQTIRDFESKIRAKAMEKLSCRQHQKFHLPTTSIDPASAAAVFKGTLRSMGLGQQLLFPPRMMVMGGGDFRDDISSTSTCGHSVGPKSDCNSPAIQQPHRPHRLIKPILADFPKPEWFQVPFRRLPTPWQVRPGTPLQRIYASVVKQMPRETDAQRQKMIFQAVDNGHIYRRIKRAQSIYNRKEQLTDFKRHQLFILHRGPVAQENRKLVKTKTNNGKHSNSNNSGTTSWEYLKSSTGQSDYDDFCSENESEPSLTSSPQ